MSDRSPDPSLTREIGSLIDALEELQREIEPGNTERRRLPTPGDLLRFTSEVTIPATILVLETNVRVLKLLQRTIRLSAGEPGGSGTTDPSGEAVREQAQALGRRTLDQLDRTLADLQSAVAGRPPDDDATALLAEARRLQDRVEAELDATTQPAEDANLAADRRSTGVNVDVEAELESIKDQLDDDEPRDGDDASPDDGGE